MASLLPRTLLWRIGLILIAAQIVILGSLSFLALRAVRGFHHDQVREELRRIEPLLAQKYHAAAVTDGIDLDDLVKKDGAQTGVRITLIFPDGTVLADSEADPSEMENHRYGRAEIESALTTGQGSAVRFSNTLKQDMIYYGRRSDWPGSTDGIVVRVSLPLTRVDSELSNLRRMILLAGAVSILLIAAVVYVISRRFSQQVQALAEAASRFSRGELDYQVSQPPARELSRLAASLNRMARQLSSRVAQLQSQQAEQQTILQSMSSGVIALDLEQRVLNLNKAAEQLIGHSADEVRGRLIQEVLRHPNLSELVARLVAGESASTAEIELDLQGRGRRIIEVKGETLAAPDDPHRGVLLLLDDVTERHRFESLRSDFAANVSHELRTPITNIKGYVETLQDVGWEDADQAGRFLEIVRSNSERLSAIVEDVMSLTKLEQPQFRSTLEFQSISVSWLFESIAEQFAEIAQHRSIEIQQEISESMQVSGHPRLLQQAIANLVSNAVRYSPAESRIMLQARSLHGELILEVVDEGPGIEEKHLSRIFERFYRVDKARSRELGGTGLGLAIVKHIANVHDGRVDVRSLVGHGSTFSIILPARETRQPIDV